MLKRITPNPACKRWDIVYKVDVRRNDICLYIAQIIELYAHYIQIKGQATITNAGAAPTNDARFPLYIE